MIAIIPAAGKGTRMAQVSQGVSKEMLRLGSGTVLDRVLEEARRSGITQIKLISAAHKEDVNQASQHAGVALKFQNIQNGLAPAVTLGFEPEQAALVLLPDTVFYPETPTPLLKQAIDKGVDIAIAVEPVPEDKVSQYGIAEFGMHTCDLYRLIEKPQPHETKSRWAVAARYAFSAKACVYLKEWIAENLPVQGELSITPVIQAALDAGFKGVVIPIESDEMVRYDCGSPEGYAKALKEIS